jgi:ABC-2 type transport system ATP-binding protein
MTDDLVIEADALHKRFGTVHALTGVDLAAPAGTVLGLLGPNGAGKTTAVRILTTLCPPDRGWARVGGFDVVGQAPQVRSVIGLAGQQAAVDPLLTGRENLELIAGLHHLHRRAARQRADELLQRFDLADAAGRRAATYSGGMARRLDLAASLIGRPRVLLLDEPTAGLDPRSRAALWDTIRMLVADGTTALLTTQYLEEADQLADHVVVLDAGRVVAEGTPDDLKAGVGGHRLDLRLSDPADTTRTAELLADLATGPPTAEGTSLTIPIPAGAGPVAEAVRRLDTAGLDLADMVVRRPTLDEVFLALTGPGHPAPAEPQPLETTR